jgi:hypothetical protein
MQVRYRNLQRLCILIVGGNIKYPDCRADISHQVYLFPGRLVPHNFHSNIISQFYRLSGQQKALLL